MKLKPGPFGKRLYHTTRPVLSITIPYIPAANTTNPGEGSEPLAEYLGRSDGSSPVVISSESLSTTPPDPYAEVRRI
jgi:hypothetical protein